MSRKTAPHGATGDARPRHRHAGCPTAAAAKAPAGAGKHPQLQPTSPSAEAATVDAPKTERTSGRKAAVGVALREADANPQDPRAQERAASRLVSAIVGGLDAGTAREALEELSAFALAYRGASEASWVGERVRRGGSVVWNEVEQEGHREACRFVLTGAANALYSHPLGRLIGALSVAVFEHDPSQVASQLGMSDGESECRDARMAVRVCRQALEALDDRAPGHRRVAVPSSRLFPRELVERIAELAASVDERNFLFDTCATIDTRRDTDIGGLTIVLSLLGRVCETAAHDCNDARDAASGPGARPIAHWDYTVPRDLRAVRASLDLALDMVGAIEGVPCVAAAMATAGRT